MNDKLLQWIRFAIASAVGATLTTLLTSLGVLPEQLIAEFTTALQTIVTIVAYVGITLAASRWPIVNKILSLFLSSQGPQYQAKN